MELAGVNPFNSFGRADSIKPFYRQEVARWLIAYPPIFSYTY
jgi:hypothetical protein